MKVKITGYAWMSKDDLTPLQVEGIKHALTIWPQFSKDYPPEDPKPVLLYKEYQNLIGLTPEFFLQNRKPHHDIEYAYTTGDKSGWEELAFKAKLRDEQSAALKALIDYWKDPNHLGCMVQAPTGWGKTVFACGVMAALQVPTLVVVHKEFLMDQWKERIQQFLPDAKIGHIQGDVCDYKGKHVVLAMVHSLAQRTDYPLDMYSYFGMMLVDEAHRIGAVTWAPVPGMFPTRYKLALTATPRRKDGCEAAFEIGIGPIVFRGKELRLKPKIKKVYSDFGLVVSPKLNPKLIKKQLLLKFLCASKKRNAQIVGLIGQAVMAGRKCLVLSERIQHLELLRDLLKETWKGPGPAPTAGMYIGGMKDSEYEESKECQILFATAQLVSEGFDLPALDTLFLTTPMSDVEQAVGRILRPSEGKKDPIVVDIRDDKVGICKRAGEQRDSLYDRIA